MGVPSGIPFSPCKEDAMDDRFIDDLCIVDLDIFYTIWDPGA